ncbi:MAG: amidohydrolase family protein [Lentisphaerae bacterium]|mgnify:CR=1 FL=1|jgi:predicted TIM-barrel fold metal-dependent hydrolase|nr:amidohydrolase family protein [Lentisphaerota bacterium]MBT4821908.1 amidohydrolase family protein [Lentisphaerota bacterium]MBT5608542.1 amidohydrolase family protein [Lentisphaerota bacterium]MBT7062197.1 amidohydrolase family protein [Lentisphaerota bacterium]MBT7844525.1 amidohydrolase family protein [Lentisphaerota bacterium]
MMDTVWLDTHVHVSEPRDRGNAIDELMAGLTDVLDAEAADLRLVISPDAHWNRIVRDEVDGVERAAAFIHDVVERMPKKLYGSCPVNPNHLDSSLRAMERCFEQWGFVMLGEMLGYMMGFDLANDAGERLARQASVYGVPVQVHISTSNAAQQGHTSGMGELHDLLALAERVPEANYILAHFVGTQITDPTPVSAYLDVIEERYGTWPRNFWAEIRDFNSPGLEDALNRIPLERLICGTDWTTRGGPPYAPYGVVFDVFTSDAPTPYAPCIDSLAAFLTGHGLTSAQVKAIAHTNAAQLMPLSR